MKATFTGFIMSQQKNKHNGLYRRNKLKNNAYIMQKELSPLTMSHSTQCNLYHCLRCKGRIRPHSFKQWTCLSLDNLMPANHMSQPHPKEIIRRSLLLTGSALIGRLILTFQLNPDRINQKPKHLLLLHKPIESFHSGFAAELNCPPTKAQLSPKRCNSKQLRPGSPDADLPPSTGITKELSKCLHVRG